MRIVIDRLTDDSYGVRNAERVIGKEVDIVSLRALPEDDLDYGYCEGFYKSSGRIIGRCSSFTCVCLDDDGYPL